MSLLLLQATLSQAALVRQLPADLALRQRAEQIISTRIREDLPCRYLGLMPLFEEHRVYGGPRTDWVVMPLEQDPLHHDQDGYPIPRGALQRLKMIHQAGIDFDTLYVAHETEKGAVEQGVPINPDVLLPPASKNTTRLSERLGEIGRGIWASVAAPLIAADATIAVLGATAAVGVLAAPLLALDPVLLGTIVSPGRTAESGEMACWFYVARWQYVEDECDAEDHSGRSLGPLLSL